MKITLPHRWDVSPEEARAIQNQLRSRVSTEADLGEIHRVAGVDIGFEGDLARAAVVVLSYPDLEPLNQSVARVPVTFPYIPGLLAFREAPAAVAALEALSTEPDLFIVDGHGLAHPRRMGIACHLGVLLDKPTIGCAKSRLVGTFREPGTERGAWTRLYAGDEVIGALVRSRSGVRPIFVSIGHKVDLETAINLTLGCCRGYRLPETTRWAHRVAGGEDIRARETQLSLFD